MDYSSKSGPQNRAYESPVTDVYFCEIENPLAKSNTETINDDDDVYDWGITTNNISL